MTAEFSTSWIQIAEVVSVTAIMYATYVVLVRIVGHRSVAGLSNADLGCVVALGAVIGRVVLLEPPTVLNGVVALVTLFSLRSLLWLSRGNRSANRVVNGGPVLLLSEGRVLADSLRRTHVAEDDLRQQLRLAGITSREEVKAVVLERDGHFSVLRRADTVEPWLLADVVE